MPAARIDHVADKNGVELLRFSRLYEFPDFVKTAKLEMTIQPDTVHISQYADPRPGKEQFPCHTAASTWLSALYFLEKKASFHEKDQARIKERLERYVNFWKIGEAYNVLLTEHTEYQKQAEATLPDESYAYVRTDSNGRKLRHLCMRNALETKSAAEYLETYRDRFSYKDRYDMAQRILTKAAAYGARIDNLEFLEKQAGRGVCDPIAVVNMLRDRASLATMPAMREKIASLADTVSRQPRQALHPDMLVDLANTMDTLDRGLGLHGRYTDKIPRPEDVLFSATYSKTAAAVMEVCPTTSGKIYIKNDFKKVSLDDVKSLFGSSFADEVRTGIDKVDPEKMASLVSTLPRPDAELFDALMADSGIRPTMAKSASASLFSETDWQRYAEIYAKK